MVHRHVALAEDRIGEGLALADRHRRQCHTIGDIADRIDRRNGAARVGIHADFALRPQRHTGLSKAEPFRRGRAAGRDKDLITGDRLAVA